MDKTLIEKIKVTNGAIYAFTHSVNYNAGIREKYNDIAKQAIDQYKVFHDQVSNDAEFKKLSTPEQQALFENTRNYSEFAEELNSELIYIDRSKHPVDVLNAMDEFGVVNMMLEALLDKLGGPSGKLLYADVRIKDKHFKKATYNNQINNLEIEVDHLVIQVGELIEGYKQLLSTIEQALLFNTYTSLVKAQAWLNNEINRVEHDGMPKAREFTLPEIVVPKVPDQKDQPKK